MKKETLNLCRKKMINKVVAIKTENIKNWIK